MFRPLPFFLGWRLFKSPHSERVVGIYSVISMIGFMIGVALLVIVLSILNGFEREFTHRVLGVISPIRIYAGEPWVDWQIDMESLLASQSDHNGLNTTNTTVAPFIDTPGMLVNQGVSQTVFISGVDLSAELASNQTIQGLYEQFQIAEALRERPSGVVLGRAIAEKLQLTVGDRVQLLTTSSQGRDRAIQAVPARRSRVDRPRSEVRVVAGIMATGTELDQQLVLMNLSEVQQMLGMQGVMGVKLSFDDPLRASPLAAELRRRWYALGHNRAMQMVDWTQTHGNLYQAIQLPKTIMWLLLVMILLVAAFNMMTTLVMMVRQKRKTLAILQSIGFGPRQITTLFLVYGLTVAAIGVVSGLIVGVAVAHAIPPLLNWVETLTGEVVFQSDSYFLHYLPVMVDYSDLVAISSVALMISVIALYFPARRAAHIDPMIAFREAA